MANPHVADGRVCRECGEFKPWEDFFKKKSGLNGRKERCKPCGAVQRKAAYGRAMEVDLKDFPEGTTKECAECGISKLLEEFTIHRRNSFQRQHVCKLCQRGSNMLRNYNLTQAEYDVMLAKQGGVCKNKMCLASPAESTKGVLAVDHDHRCCPGDKSCGKCIRGLTCGQCNMALGLMRDSIDRLNGLINYLESYE